MLIYVVRKMESERSAASPIQPITNIQYAARKKEKENKLGVIQKELHRGRREVGHPKW